MNEPLRIVILLAALVFGGLFGLWYYGSYAHFAMYWGSTDVLVRADADEMRKAIESPGGIRFVHTVPVFGYLPFRLVGQRGFKSSSHFGQRSFVSRRSLCSAELHGDQ